MVQLNPEALVAHARAVHGQRVEQVGAPLRLIVRLGQPEDGQGEGERSGRHGDTDQTASHQQTTMRLLLLLNRRHVVARRPPGHDAK